MNSFNLYSDVKCVVIKIGTSILSSGNKVIDRQRVNSIIKQVCKLSEKKIKVVLVSSGAIAYGMWVLGKKKRPQSLPMLQACAAIGQNKLMNMYENAFAKNNYIAAQILLTQEGLKNRVRYLNAKNTILSLLDLKIIPIVNENDTVSTQEIKFGDNDRLSALVANLIEADLLVILSDVDGLYKRYDHTKNNDFCLVSSVKKIDVDIEKIACGTLKQVSVGGMSSKIEAAKIAEKSGIYTLIANGNTKNIITKIFENKQIGTLFHPHGKKLSAKKRWIAFSSMPKGIIVVDSGAEEALISNGKSLLSSGIVKIKADFNIGDVVSIENSCAKEIARGLVNYSSKEVEKIKGIKTTQIKSVLGYKYYDEVVHRDNLVVL